MTGPCLCGAYDCRSCYPGGYSEGPEGSGPCGWCDDEDCKLTYEQHQEEAKEDSRDREADWRYEQEQEAREGLE